MCAYSRLAPWLAAIAIGPSACASRPSITQDELVRRTQQLFDAVAPGVKAPWNTYLAEDCMLFDEVGHDQDKTAVLAALTPLPPGYSGAIHVARAHSHIENNIAILSYDLDETELVFGQRQTARYHGTDTWLRRHGTWQLVAGQIFRYYEDPAVAELDPSAFAVYVGTYELAPGETLTIAQDGGHLYRQRGQAPKAELLPEAVDVFFRRGVEGRILFHRDARGSVDRLIDRRNNEDVIWQRLPGH